MSRPLRGSAPSLLYDASRLCTRVLNPTPNGIDRLDVLLARGLLGPDQAHGTAAALVFGWGGPRLVPPAAAVAALDRTERSWREGQGASGDDEALACVLASLAPDRPAWRRPSRMGGSRFASARRLGRGLGTLMRLGLHGGGDPGAVAARGAVYLNASHFPLDWPSHVAWLDRRPDIRPVVLVHDLLPLDHPDWFWEGEAARHRTRLAFLARRGAGAIVTSAAVEERLRAEMARAGRPGLPVLRVAPPIAATFRAPRQPDRGLASLRYFVTCGTIEPRKNHALLLRLWGRLAAEWGAGAPKLVVVGKRGWHCGEILGEMRRLVRAGHLVLAHDLPSGAYRDLLDRSLGLLAPSWAEGYGLPVAEALARGVPVIASDIPSFREQRADVLIDPRDEDAWYVAIAAAGKAAPRGRFCGHRPIDDDDDLGAVRRFLGALP